MTKSAHVAVPCRLLIVFVAVVVIAFAFALLAPVQPAHAAKSYSGKKVTASNPVVVIRVAYSTAKYNEGWGGVFEAAPVKRKAGYELYDVVLWPDRISCYRFKKDFAEIWQDHGQTHTYATNAAYEKAYRKLRETYSIYSKKIKIGDGEFDDATKHSKKKYAAFKAIFKAVKKRTPSKHVVIKYSGHGGGVNFCNCMNEKYSLKTLKAGTKTFKAKFAIVDYGTNCMSASAYTMRKYAPYVDYMVASQQDWGGWNWDSKTEDKDGYIKDEYLHKDSDSRYHEAFGKGVSIKSSAKKLVNLNRDEWKTYSSGYIKKHKVECSNTAVNLKSFGKLYKKMSGSKRNHKSGDVYTAVKKSSKLKKLYKKAVINYKSSRSLGVKWKSKDHGISLW